MSFFSTPLGGTATLIVGTVTSSKVKTLRDTNMANSNVVPTKMFKFVGISLDIVNRVKAASPQTNGDDIDLIMKGGYLQFNIVDKTILQMPLDAFPLLSTVTASTGNNATYYGYGGGPGVFMYKLPINITLNPYENFSVSLNFDPTITLTASLDIYVYLQGFQRRPT